MLLKSESFFTYILPYYLTFLKLYKKVLGPKFYIKVLLLGWIRTNSNLQNDVTS